MIVIFENGEHRKIISIIFKDKLTAMLRYTNGSTENIATKGLMTIIDEKEK